MLVVLDQNLPQKSRETKYEDERKKKNYELSETSHFLLQFLSPWLHSAAEKQNAQRKTKVVRIQNFKNH